ncbi:hypothetical protein BDZ85DRAFT_73110 [Elsinoe ampelina]|uniref:Uncharacterized protein n=1 Tax=Elsinoe ampelina TaxID=302913 RepID=A0A6A6GK15_9PEZI|nr:hypothetical protein BDZ85DRAFT_73110 [Elsinoe ampelina]
MLRKSRSKALLPPAFEPLRYHSPHDIEDNLIALTKSVADDREKKEKALQALEAAMEQRFNDIKTHTQTLLTAVEAKLDQDTVTEVKPGENINKATTTSLQPLVDDLASDGIAKMDATVKIASVPTHVDDEERFLELMRETAAVEAELQIARDAHRAALAEWDSLLLRIKELEDQYNHAQC